MLATCSSDSTIKLFDVSGPHPQFITDIRGHTGPVWKVSWAHPRYGSVLASAGFDGKTVVWQNDGRNSWSPVHVDNTHSSSVNSVAFNTDPTGALQLATVGLDGNLVVITYDQGNWSSKHVPAHPNGALCVDWMTTNSGQTFIVTGGCDGKVKLWSCANTDWVEAYSLGPMENWVRSIACRPCSIAATVENGYVYVWEPQEGGSTMTWKVKQTLHVNDPRSVAWIRSGRVLAATDSSGETHTFTEADGI